MSNHELICLSLTSRYTQIYFSHIYSVTLILAVLFGHLLAYLWIYNYQRIFNILCNLFQFVHELLFYLISLLIVLYSYCLYDLKLCFVLRISINIASMIKMQINKKTRQITQLGLNKSEYMASNIEQNVNNVVDIIKMQEQQQLEQKTSNEIKENKDENGNEVKHRQYKVRLQTNQMKMLFNHTNFQHFNIEQFRHSQLFQLQSFRNLYYKLSFWLKYRNKQGAKWNNKQLGYLFSTIFQQLKRISVLPIQDATKQLQKIIQLYKTDNIFKTKSLYQLKMPKPQLYAQQEAENQYQKRIQMDYNLPDKPRITFRRGSKIIRNVRSQSLVSTAQIVFCSKLQSLNLFTESKQIKDFMLKAQKNKVRVKAENTRLYRYQTLTKPLSLFTNEKQPQLTKRNENMTRQTEVTVQSNERKLGQKKRALSQINGINLIKPSDLTRATRSKTTKKLKLKSSKSVSPKKKKKKLKLKLKQKKDKEKLKIRNGH